MEQLLKSAAVFEFWVSALQVAESRRQVEVFLHLAPFKERSGYRGSYL